ELAPSFSNSTKRSRMPALIDTLTNLSKAPYYRNEVTPLLQYVNTGDEALVTQIRQNYRSPKSGPYWLHAVWEHLASPNSLSEMDRRAMCGMLAMAGGLQLANWIEAQIKDKPTAAAETYLIFLEVFGDSPPATADLAAALIQHFGAWLES